MKNIILSSIYAGNIEYYSLIYNSDNIIIDVSENYRKQSFRNRCEIYGANGKLNLIIPVTKSNNYTPINRKKIDYCENWQKIHWKSLESSYRTSPYFEFYELQLKKLYNNRFIYLSEFNIELNNLILSLLNIEKNIIIKDKYQDSWGDTYSDFRNKINPKIKTAHLSNEYYQVFQEKYGFLSNISILDLLFNHGSEAINYL